MKKGFIFTLDAIIGLTITIAIILSFNFLKTEMEYRNYRYQKATYRAQDIMRVISTLRANEMNSEKINELASQGFLTKDDLEKSVLDLVTSLFYSGNKTLAEDILKDFFSQAAENFCVEVSVLSSSLDSEPIYISCDPSDVEEYAVSSRIETGYDLGKPTKGYMSRAFLNKIRGKMYDHYYYFGGYIGDGNITFNVSLPQNSSVKSVLMEMDAGSTFNLYVNGVYSGTYQPYRTGLEPSSWFVCNLTFPSYCTHFDKKNNTININFTSNSNNYIGGGYIKITYETSELSLPSSLNQSIYYFPGVSGIINLYSSFYSPGQLKFMETYLHFRNNYTTFFTIGNKTLYRTNSTSEQKVKLNNTYLSSQLNYTFYSGKTVPVKLGTEAFQIMVSGFGIGDSILVTDLSGSMKWCSNEPPGEDPHSSYEWTTWVSGGSTYGGWRWVAKSNCDPGYERKIDIAKRANSLFINTIMNTSGNRLGLSDYTGSQTVYNYTRGRWVTMFPDNMAGYLNLTNNSITLHNHNNQMDTWWGTCICCGINKAREMLAQQSNSQRKKSIVLMSDGEANIRCSQQGTGNAKSDAILAGQQACQENITVYTVGYGNEADENTLKQIACNSSYYYNSTNVDNLINIYQQIAEEISKGSFESQTINVTGNVSMQNILYPDSYILVGFEPEINPFDYGEVELTKETSIISNMTDYNSTREYVEGSYYIPPELKVVDAKTISYSSEFWTDKVSVKRGNASSWSTVYNLSSYGEDYLFMGDPFIVHIPSNSIESGAKNYIKIGTGLSPKNYTGGSPYDRVIYKVRLKGSVGYGEVFNNSEDAVYDANQRLINQVSGYVNVSVEDIQVENQTISGIQWLWGPSLLRVIVWEK